MYKSRRLPARLRLLLAVLCLLLMAAVRAWAGGANDTATNTADGFNALHANTSANGNTAVGENLAPGYLTGRFVGGNHSIDRASDGVAGDNGIIRIGDTDGQPYSERCEQVNAMLLNEFLKEHARVRALEAEISAGRAATDEKLRAFDARLAAATFPGSL